MGGSGRTAAVIVGRSLFQSMTVLGEKDFLYASMVVLYW